MLMRAKIIRYSALHLRELRTYSCDGGFLSFLLPLQPFRRPLARHNCCTLALVLLLCSVATNATHNRHLCDDMETNMETPQLCIKSRSLPSLSSSSSLISTVSQAVSRFDVKIDVKSSPATIRFNSRNASSTASRRQTSHADQNRFKRSSLTSTKRDWSWGWVTDEDVVVNDWREAPEESKDRRKDKEDLVGRARVDEEEGKNNTS